MAGLAGMAALTAMAAEPASAASSTVRLYKVVYDPSGTDTHANSQINREYVVLKNGQVDTCQWKRDSPGHVTC